MYGPAVREARRQRGLTQSELARVSGIAQANISAIENGRRQPSAETLHRLLDACGFDLVARAGPREIPLPPPPAPGEPALVAELLAARRTASPFDQPSLVSVDTSPEDRARLLVAALDASEAIVRGRKR